MPIEEGKKAPAFSLKDQNGVTRTLKDYEGEELVLYFYPRDDTPGCTKEAQGFRDLHTRLAKRGVRVVGVSPDGAQSHVTFIAKHKLPFTLLSDADKKVMAKYGAFGEKTLYGKKTTGVIRSTVWIGPDGKVKRHWKRVAKAADHPARVLEAIEQG
jgi:peroxiredoxin Q/BCP